MNKNIDLKNRIVDIYDVNTGLYEDEIVSFLKRKMSVRFHSAKFDNNKYVFTGTPNLSTSNTITVTGFRKKQTGEKFSVIIE